MTKLLISSSSSTACHPTQPYCMLPFKTPTSFGILNITASRDSLGLLLKIMLPFTSITKSKTETGDCTPHYQKIQQECYRMCAFTISSLSITLSRSCCLFSIKVRAWKVFFFWSGFPGVTPERCSVAVCLWYAKPIYRLCRRAVASHHNSQPQDTSSVCPCAPALCSQALH